MNALPSLLKIENLSVHYQKAPALWGVNLNIEAGKCIGIIGPNGSGKSTLLKACVGLLQIKTGRIEYFSNLNLEDAKRWIAYLPQRESIDWDFPISVLEVALMGSYPRVGLFKRPGKEEKDFALHCLREVGMQDYAQRQIGALSGGQQQRVFLARALTQKAKLYMLDEPFAAVDQATEEIIHEVIQKLTQQGHTVMLVHHDLFSVQQNTDEVILMNTRLIKHGKTADVFQRSFLEEAFGAQMKSLAQVLHLSESSRS